VFAEVSQPSQSLHSRLSTKTAFLLILVSSIVPGTGHALLGHSIGWIYAILWFLLLAAWPIVAPVSVVTCYVVLLLSIPIGALAMIDLLSRHGNLRPHKWLKITMCVFLAFFLSGAVADSTIRLRGYRRYHVPAEGMDPTIPAGATVLADMRAYRTAKPADGEIILFRDDSGTLLLKRLIGTEGNLVELRSGHLFINEESVEESYAAYEGSDSDLAPRTFGPVKVPSGKVFVLGDNRDFSLDSRAQQFGFVDESRIRGKVISTLK